MSDASSDALRADAAAIYDPGLLPHHAEILRASAVDPDVASERGYKSVTVKAELRRLGFGEAQTRVPALLLPVYDVAGEIALYQIRPDTPRIKGGKPLKYETPRGARMVLDVPPRARPMLKDPAIPLFITEGVRKADAAASQGLCAIDLLGVWNWRGTNDDGGKMALADWESVALNDRVVYLVFDSDILTKPPVAQALTRLKEFLEQRKARVHVVYLPAGEAGAKVGLDDYLAAGHGVDDLVSLVRSEPLVSEKEHPSTFPYESTDRGLVRIVPTRDGVYREPLTNFTAVITANIMEDDGATRRRFFEIEVHRGDAVATVRVPAAEFGLMNWVPVELGAGAFVHAGAGTRDHARCAIQVLSPDPPDRTIYTHTGWCQIDGRWVYLHAGGAIGGADLEVEVRLPEGLESFHLPDPPQGERLHDAIRASLAMLDVAPDHVTVPAFTSVCRAPVHEADFSIAYHGASGGGKSEMGALSQQHFGARMTRTNLPGNWSSTANANEALTFHAKDALLVIDDYAPIPGTNQANRMAQEADRIYRGKGNAAGRRRMRSDASLRPPMYARGLILTTGEDIPRGHSLRARVLFVEVPKPCVDWDQLTTCQKDAADGLYAATMSGYLAWMAPQYEQIHASIHGEVHRIRSELPPLAHPRTPDMVAQLLAGARLFLRFATEVGAISEPESVRLDERFVAALLRVAREQADHHVEVEPAKQFVGVLRAALVAGAAHVANPLGEVPTSSPERLGWRKDGSQWWASGERVGWVDGGDLFLEPDAAYRAVQRYGRDAGQDLAISAATLRRRLHEAGLLRETERRGNKLRLTVRRPLQGARRPVLHLSVDALFSGVSRVAHEEANHASSATSIGGSWATLESGVAHEVAHGELEERDRSSNETNSTDVAEEGDAAAPPVERPRPCWTCRGGQLWRRRNAAKWICERCHPPTTDQNIERVTVRADAPQTQREEGGDA